MKYREIVLPLLMHNFETAETTVEQVIPYGLLRVPAFIQVEENKLLVICRYGQFMY